jgi:hypothetical protein
MAVASAKSMTVLQGRLIWGELLKRLAVMLAQGAAKSVLIRTLTLRRGSVSIQAEPGL